MPMACASATRSAARWPCTCAACRPGSGALRVGIALQLVFGTLVNAVLHDPGPIGLNDPRMESELTRVFLHSIGLD